MEVLAAFTGTELMWIAIVVLVLFGAKKVPELMRGVGQGIKEFKKATKDVQDEVHRAIEESDREPVATPRRPENTVAKQTDDAPVGSTDAKVDSGSGQASGDKS
jgi:sec-independent protein translocase protein TatA